jgi:CRISPR/Cas system CSM-associated protein Csm4 (group 5 of RAMP superfamily)
MYGNKILSFKEKKFLKELIGRDLNPIFHIVKIPKLQTNNSKHSLAKGRVALKNQKCLVAIENAPSRAEIYTILNKYLENKNSKQEFVAENKGSRVDITFNNPVL